MHITLVEALKTGRTGGPQKELSNAKAKTRLKQLKNSYTAAESVLLAGSKSSGGLSARLPFMALASPYFTAVESLM